MIELNMAKKKILNPDLVPYKQDKLKNSDVLGYVGGLPLRYGGNVNVPTDSDIQALRSDMEEIESAIGGTVTPRSYNPVIDLASKQELRVLDIGNSFSDDPIAYLSRFAYADTAVDMSTICFYSTVRSSGSYKTFYDSWRGQDNQYSDGSGCSYRISKRFGELTQNITGSNRLEQLHSAIKDCKWDVIMIHQVSSYSGEYETWEGYSDGGYLTEFLRILKVYQPQAMIGYLMPHAAYDQNNNTAQLWGEIATATKKIQANYAIDFIVPVATAIENLRASTLKNSSIEYGFSRDKHHLGYGLARYVAAATYFHALLGRKYSTSVFENRLVYAVSDDERSSSENKYPNESVDVTASNKTLAQLCALLACCNAYTITPPEGIAETI